MNSSKFFLSTLIAAAAMTAPAYATDYTVTDNSSNLIDAVSGDTVTIDFSENANSYLYADSASEYTINADVVIVNATIHNGYSSKTYTFNGTITGGGAFYYQADKGSNNQTYIFNGDVSGYSGDMTIASGKNGTFTFTNKTGTGAITATNALSVLNLNGATVNNSAIDVSTINISGTTSFAAESTTLTGNVVVAADSEVTVSGVLTVSSAISNSGAITFGEGASLALTEVTASSITGLVESTTGLQEVVSTYTIATGGTVSGLTTANVTVNGAGVTSVSDDGLSATISESVYNIGTDASVAYSDISSDDLAATDYINVAGTLTGFGLNTTTSVSGGGRLEISLTGNHNDYSMDTFATFTGTLILGGSGRMTFHKNSGTIVNGFNTIEIGAETQLYLSSWGNHLGNVSTDILIKDGAGTKRDYGASLRAGDGSVLSGDLTIEADTTIAIDAGGVTLGGVITSSNLVKIVQGATKGELYITGNSNNLTGTLQIAGGTVYVGPGGQNAGADANLTTTANGTKIIIENGASFITHLGGGAAASPKTFNGDIYVKNGATLGNKDGHVSLLGDVHWGVTNSGADVSAPTYSSDSVVTYTQYWGKTITFAGNLFGDGTVNLGQSSKEANANYVISGEGNTFAGTYSLSAGEEKTTTLTLGTSTSAAFAKVNLSTAQTSLNLGADAVTIAGLSGTGSVALSGVSASALTVNGDGEFAGTIANGISVVKSGSGSLTLSGDNSANASGMTISGGTLVAANANALGAGAVTVKEDATLTFATTVSGVTGGVEINEGATFAIDLTNFAQTVSEGDKVGFAILTDTALTFNGAGTDTLSSGDIDSYFDVEGSTLGAYSEWAREWSYNTDSNTLSLTMTIPEPSAFGLLAGVGALALVVARRKRRK